MASSLRMKYASDAKKASKKANNLDSNMKKAKEKLIIKEAARKAIDVVVPSPS